TRDGRAVVLSAAHPIWSGDEVTGAVVTEETTNSVMSVKSEALERLLWLTLAAFAGAGILLMVFATRLSMRIRRLRDEAESAIDARGHIVTRLAAGSGARDEIGDLSRSFSAVLERLAEHHSYLESMAGRLSHELRTPIAVVRSSLENLKLSPENAALYIERAEQGLARLGRILERMAEASRLEQSLRALERERYDLAAVVRGCVEGYRLAYPQTGFALELPPGRKVEVEGAPDLAAQLLDKLVENAVDFAKGDAPVRVALDDAGGAAVLTVTNKGPLLPDKMRTRLFESMISMREAGGTGAPHLGLGLFVARLIAEFHGGTIAASNLPAAMAWRSAFAFRWHGSDPRPAGHRRRHQRRRHRARRRWPRVVGGTGRTRRSGGGDFVGVLETDPWRAALSRALRVPPGLRGARRARDPAAGRRPSHLADALCHAARSRAAPALDDPDRVVS